MQHANYGTAEIVCKNNAVVCKNNQVVTKQEI